MSKVKVIPCSGIGKVFGLMARESALLITETISPDMTEIACLGHIVTGDEDAVSKVKGLNCITIDGCNAYCAANSVEEAGGNICQKYRTIDWMKNHRGKDAGTGTALSDDGWIIIKEFADKIAEKIQEIAKEAE